MKISIVITLGIVAVIAIAVIATIGGGLDQSSQSKIRVAFFPSIGHAVPIVGIKIAIDALYGAKRNMDIDACRFHE